VHPLLSEQWKLLDPDRNPYLQRISLGLFLATRKDQARGRIMVSHDPDATDLPGKFGFFECADDQEVASSLVNVATSWARDRGARSITGPFSPTVHDEVGVLVEGFDTPPAFLTSYNPPYYERLLRGAGLLPEMDLLGYSMTTRTPVPERVERVVRRLLDRGTVSIRTVDMTRFDEDAETIRRLYNACWESNWGFEAMDEKEFSFLASGLRRILDPDLLLIAEAAGRPVGFSLALPDLNVALAHIRGRLFPTGLLRLLLEARNIHRVRVAALGTLPEFRKRGLDGLLYIETYRRGADKGYDSGEFSWVLEGNQEMNGAMEALGATPSKRWRLYSSPSGP
jgi:GNAT superfamily N-acetyltransferase